MYHYNEDTTCPISKMVNHLREEHRLKILCDYAYIHNCATFEFIFICSEVWREDIKEHAEEFGVKIEAIRLAEGVI